MARKRMRQVKEVLALFIIRSARKHNAYRFERPFDRDVANLTQNLTRHLNHSTTPTPVKLPPGVSISRGYRAPELQPSYVQPIDKCVDHPDWRICRDIIFNRRREQGHLTTIRTQNVAHGKGRMVDDAAPFT